MNEHMSPIPSRIYNAAVGGHVAGADQIIDDKTGFTLDKISSGALEEKEYISSSNNGMGRVVLRKNLVEGVNTLTQSMINKSNTIYVIQYDFDLNDPNFEHPITIPENCVLEFNGGSLSNGVLNTDISNKILGFNKIFTNIKFNGYYKYAGTVELDWFISKYAKSVEDTSVDNYSDFVDAINSGCYNLLIDNSKYIHLTNTIEITRPLNIYAKYSRKYTIGFSSNLSDSYKLEDGCIFSKSIVTLLRYKVKNETKQIGDRPITIGNINLYINKPYETLDDIDVPILDIRTDGANLWGITLSCNIKSKRYTISALNDTICNYTGIHLESSNGYITFVEINGYISGVYKGINAKGYPHNTNNWFTNIVIKGDSWCVFGGTFYWASPCYVYGSHQTDISNYSINNNRGYFEGFVELKGYVWDYNRKSPRTNLHSVSYPVKYSNLYYIGELQTYNYGMRYPQNLVTYLDFYKDTYINAPNLLDVFLAGSNVLYSPIIFNKSSYKIDNIDILKDSYSDIHNRDSLFNMYADGNKNATPIERSGNAYLTNCRGKVCSIDLWIDGYSLHPGTSAVDNAIILYYDVFSKLSNGTLRITIGDDINSMETLYSKELNTGNIYYNTINKIRIPIARYINIHLDLSIDAGTYLLPKLYIPSAIRSSFRGPSSLRPNWDYISAGKSYFDTTLNKPIWWTGDKWVKADGTDVNA